MHGRVRRGRVTVGTCSVRSGYCQDVIGEDGYYWDVFGEVWFVSERVRRSRLCVGTCPAK